MSDKVDKAIIKIKQISDDLDRSLCDPTCQLYDGRLCDIASNCERRRDWKVVTNSRLLSEKEIDDITETGDTLDEFAIKLIKAQLSKTDEEWMAWFEGICTKHEADNPDGFDQVIQMRMDCFECWEERKKEIGL